MRKVSVVSLATIENGYDIALDEESQCNKKVTVILFLALKISILIDI
jgi:hypothetical protein